MTQPINKCYNRVYNDTVKADQDVGDLGVLHTDAFGNEWYDMVKKYKRVDKDGNPKTTGTYRRCTYEGKIECGTASGTKIPTPVPDAPDSCAKFAPDAAAYKRYKSDSLTLNPLSAYVERNVDNEEFDNNCQPRNPFTTVTPVVVGSVVLTYMDDTPIARVEGDNALVLTETNTEILVEVPGNV